MPDLSGPFKPGEATNKGPGDGKPIKAHKDLQNKKHHERAWDNEETRDYSRSPCLVLLPPCFHLSRMWTALNSVSNQWRVY